jgi:hypothetical protein
MLLSAAVAITLPKPSGIRTLVMTVILRLICSAGPQPTLMLLGTATVVLKGVHLLSIMGNAGTFQRSVRQICTDTEIVYHVIYLIFCFLGLSTHPFFFSVLLFDVVYREETLLNVIRSVTRNGRSIVLTAVLALILVYMFSIIGYLSFLFLIFKRYLTFKYILYQVHFLQGRLSSRSGWRFSDECHTGILFIRRYWVS